jgi:molybdate transport system regulatory protein
MTRKKPTEDTLSLHLRLRIFGQVPIALGPGKVELLGKLAETGSIGEAARRMGMSYMKAWSLIQTMKPLVATTRGGTETGRQALALYQKMQQDSRQACETSWMELRQLLQKGS